MIRMCHVGLSEYEIYLQFFKLAPISAQMAETFQKGVDLNLCRLSVLDYNNVNFMDMLVIPIYFITIFQSQ